MIKFTEKIPAYLKTRKTFNNKHCKFFQHTTVFTIITLNKQKLLFVRKAVPNWSYAPKGTFLFLKIVLNQFPNLKYVKSRIQSNKNDVLFVFSKTNYCKPFIQNIIFFKIFYLQRVLNTWVRFNLFKFYSNYIREIFNIVWKNLRIE